MALVAYVASLLAVIINKTKARLKILSETDQLTELLNMRAFNQKFAKELERSKRHGSPFSIVMVDINDLKIINDTYGHESGNETIIRQHRRCPIH